MAHLLHEIEPYNESGRTTPLTGFKIKEPVQPNIHEVVLGDWWVRPSSPSFYPEEIVGKSCDRLYVCQWCFKYINDAVPDRYLRHMEICSYRDIHDTFGAPIYSQPSYTIHELDGSDHTLFAQNLSLFAKLFLDSKSVSYDVTTFLFYILVLSSEGPSSPPPRIIGFFSKEKLSWDSNNLACILVFPPWQKRGYGQLLMGVSYFLGEREGRHGGPEKPLSELGRRAYVQYWAGMICRFVVGLAKAVKTISVEAITEGTYIATEDVIGTLREMGVLERRASVSGKGKKSIGGGVAGMGGIAVISKAKVRDWMMRNKVSPRSPVVEEAFDLPELTDESETEESD